MAATLPVRRRHPRGRGARRSRVARIQVGPRACREIDEGDSGEGTGMERTAAEGASGDVGTSRGERPARRASGDRPTSRRCSTLLPQPAFVVEIGDDEACQFVLRQRRATARCSTSTSSGDLAGDLRAGAPARRARRARHRVLTGEPRGPVGVVRRRRSTAAAARSRSRSRRCPRTSATSRHLLGVVHDVTEHKRIEALLAHRARHDPLTELPNRVMLLEMARRRRSRTRTRDDAAASGSSCSTSTTSRS